ncbi:FAD-binding oxidoreductase [Pelagicoccus mobilis]|uniref:FAD-binding protein n=1 Tax=Pelagicoccus mobilis TaxID=415221 RepID=A0A934S538_9BACT|nr:FAD-linked oxidase C-terminal domain-containing protein [Pelagicoccus mobilis]MBK1879123.1 FAD-binding protein [Pelagicoccus mobilis]
MVAPIPQALESLLSPEQILSSAEDLIVYGYDGTAGLKQRPLAVVFPESAEDVSKVLRLAAERDIPVTTRGSGTGLSGGSIPSENGIVLCLQRMNKILEFDTANLTILVEPGVVTETINQAVSKEGLLYPPDPGSMKISTIGGNVANNSGGLRGLKYGVTRDYVMGMQAVLPNGETIWLGNKCVKDVAGYNLKDLFIGSEGTLGVITQILLKLVPRPVARRTMLALFDSMEDAAAAVSKIIAAKIIPCTLEFVDRFTLQCVEDFAQAGLPTDCEAVLLIETDGHPAQVEEEAEQIQNILAQSNARETKTAKNEEEANQLATARRSAFAALARIRPTTILEDVTVPRDKLAEMIRFVQKTAEKHDLKIASFGHFGDGNLHPTILADERDADEMKRVHQALEDLFEKTLELGGTITGEHGVGLAKKAHLHDQYQDYSYTLLKQIKKTLDPQNLLNPGKTFDV